MYLFSSVFCPNFIFLQTLSVYLIRIKHLFLGNLNRIGFGVVFTVIAGLVTRMTRRHLLLYREDQRIPFAIEKYPLHKLDVAGSFTLDHQSILGATEHVYLARLDRFDNGVLIHIAQRKRLPIRCVYNYRWDKPFFIKV